MQQRMSLRAKIEAVVYAAEEPVTLAQLAALFGAEALEERAQGRPEGAAGAEQGWIGFEGQPEQSAEYAGRPATDTAIEQAVEHPEQVAATQADGFAAESEGPATTGEAPGDPATGATEGAAGEQDESRRLVRQRERVVREQIRRTIDELIAAYDQGDRGIEIREIAGGYRVATKPEYHDAVRGFVKSLKPPMKLSLQALETLAVIAYKQPVTAPEVSEIRGVDSGGVLGSLISRKLVTTAGRKQVIGRPILYKTTKEFLLRFGLKDIAELPSMEEFERMAGELVEPEETAQLSLRAPGGSGSGTTLGSGTGQAEAPLEDHAQGETDVPESQPQSLPERLEAKPDETVEQTPEEMRESSRDPLLAATDGLPATAAEVQAAPELAEERENEELAANARANVQVDDESTPLHDLPGVHRDTAGRVGIDSRLHPLGVFDEDQA